MNSMTRKWVPAASSASGRRRCAGDRLAAGPHFLAEALDALRVRYRRGWLEGDEAFMSGSAR